MLHHVDPTIIIGGVVTLVGPTGIVWFALRFNREDARAAVDTMKEVSGELRLELERAHKERDALATALEKAYEQRGLLEKRVKELTDETTALRAECGRLRQEVTLLRESNEAER